MKRGLIIGDVQSGKTSTYIGLICKAADAGYKVFILLTGTIEAVNVRTVYTEVIVNCGEKKWVVHCSSSDYSVGNTVGLKIDPEAIDIIRTVESELSATQPQEEEE